MDFFIFRTNLQEVLGSIPSPDFSADHLYGNPLRYDHMTNVLLNHDSNEFNDWSAWFSVILRKCSTWNVKSRACLFQQKGCHVRIMLSSHLTPWNCWVKHIQTLTPYAPEYQWTVIFLYYSCVSRGCCVLAKVCNHSFFAFITCFSRSSVKNRVIIWHIFIQSKLYS